MARDDGRQPTIATAALAGRLLAEADFSRSGRRKMASGVLDDGSACGCLQKRFSRSERALAVQGRRHYSICCVRNEILSFKF